MLNSFDINNSITHFRPLVKPFLKKRQITPRACMESMHEVRCMESVADGMESVADGMESVVDGMKSVAGGMESVVDGMKSVAGGMESVTDGMESVADGMESVADGMESRPKEEGEEDTA